MREWKETDMLSMYVIYEKPADYPDLYVVREWRYGAIGKPVPKGILMGSKDLETCRKAMIEKKLYNMGRFKEDDACIVETWI